MEFVKWMDGQSKLIKALLCIPVVAVFWVVYRVVKSVAAKDWLGTILAVLLIVVGLPWLWLVDLICILVQDKVLWFN